MIDAEVNKTHMATSTSPNPNAQSFPGTPVHAQPHHSPDPMQMPMSMSYPGHPHPHPHPHHQPPGGPPMGFPAWPDTPGGLGVGVNMVMPYGIFGDASGGGGGQSGASGASSPPPPPPPPPS